jgi:hypothetical protein
VVVEVVEHLMLLEQQEDQVEVEDKEVMQQVEQVIVHQLVLHKEIQEVMLKLQDQEKQRQEEVVELLQQEHKEQVLLGLQEVLLLEEMVEQVLLIQ